MPTPNKLPTQYRTFNLDRQHIDEDARTVELSFSSEEPVKRFFGDEILDHSPGSARLGRLANGGAVLVDHSHPDHVGVVESVSIDKDRRGRAVARFGRSERAKEVFNDVIDGIRHLISFGYRVHELTLVSRGEGDDDDVYRSFDWEPFEISFVSVPADATVGVGRAEADELLPVEIRTMTTPNIADPKIEPKPATLLSPPDLEAAAKRGAEEESTRIREIIALGRTHNMDELADQFVTEKRAVHEFTAEILKSMRDTPTIGGDQTIGLTDKEIRKFSIVRAIDAMANPTDRRKAEAAAFEFDASRAAAEKLGISPQGVMFPVDVMNGTRDLSAGTSTAGGHTVATDLLEGSFIGILRNQTVVINAGATVLGDLQGNIAIPRHTTSGTGYWVSTEGGAVTESQQVFDQVTMTPKTAGGLTEYTRQLLLQSSIDIEAFVRGDILQTLALLIDLAGLYGSGSSGQPTGITNTTGINTPTAFAAAVPTYAEVVAMESAAGTDNALMGTLSYVMEAAMRGSLKTTDKASGAAQFVWEPGNTVNGYPAHVSNQVTSGDIFFANWADLLIGMWGGLDVTVDPYTSSSSGTVRIVALQSMDLAVRHPVSFVFNNDT